MKNPGRVPNEGRDGNGVYGRTLPRKRALCNRPREGDWKAMQHADLEDALSLERFGRYMAWAAGDRDRAIALYGHNTRLSESLYTPLQTLEVVLRNRIHNALTQAKGDTWLYDHTRVLRVPHQIQQITKAMMS
ncbi:hypothetical protein [Stenotrophomonas sp. ESTM1D_MKCIP4_1]|uniref:hypothetical protein n=1 Tax=Stenotrophomonas sp. ESTM1D_MKCIP4_1 TaxID=2072414 RepID=UPI0020B15B3D|nr:hypothetical protein [Stenotrophomonas sp. ESTM1D_MKCIP4_1]